MAAYIVRRLLSMIPVLLGVSLVVFFVLRMLPGDVAAMILMGAEQDASVTTATPEALAALRVQLGLDQPLWQQYLSWIWGLLTFDAGDSLWSRRPVSTEIGSRLPLTIELALLSLVMSLAFSLPIGIISALKKNSWFDYVFRTFSIGGLAVPSFWLGTLLLLGLTIFFNWTPPLGYAALHVDPWKNLQQLFWPAVVIGYGNAAVISRMTRSTMLEVMREDYVRTAWAKGLRYRTILLIHALRNALLPVLTLTAIEFGHLLGGTVLLETIFTLPGVGRYLIEAIHHRDYPVVQTVVLLMATLFLTLNLLVDLLYGVFDPRVRYE